MAGYYVIRLISFLVCRMPVSLCKKIANGLGRFVVGFCPEWRLKMAVANIQECLNVDEDTANRIAIDSLNRFGRMIVEVLRFPLLRKENIQELVHVDGIEYIERALSLSKGGVMASAHFGNWELIGAFWGLRNIPILSIVRHQNQGGMNRLINEFRECVGQKITYNRGEKNFFKIVRMLKKSYFVGILYDQDTNDIGVKLKLFGKECIVPDGACALSRINGAPIIPMFIHNNEDWTATIKVYPALVCQGKGDYERVMGELTGILEQEIIRYPSMWFWVHDRWKDGRQRFGLKK